MFGEFSLKQADLLSNIVKQSALFGLYKTQSGSQAPVYDPEIVRENCVRLLAAILPYKSGLFEAKSIVDLDMFHFMVYLSLTMPNLYEPPSIKSLANWQINYFNIFKLCLQAHCVQIVLIKLKNKKIFEQFAEDSGQLNNQEELQVFEFYTHIIELIVEHKLCTFNEEEKLKLKSNPKVVNAVLKKSLMPFLRCSALFFSNLTDLKPSAKITASAG